MIITASTPIVKCEYLAQEESRRAATTHVGSTEIKRAVSGRYVVVCYVPVGSLSHLLFARLIPSGAFKGWCAVRTLQMYFSNGFLISRLIAPYKLTLNEF